MKIEVLPQPLTICKATEVPAPLLKEFQLETALEALEKEEISVQ
jgi:hypothetical protein